MTDTKGPVVSWRGSFKAAGPAVALVVASLTLSAWAFGMRPDRLDAPLAYGGDAVYYQAMIQGALDNGWYLDNPSLGRPAGQDLRPFPVSDGWALWLLIKALGLLTPDAAVVMNLFYWLGFPLAALSAYFVNRRLGACPAVAACTGLLFAFLPFRLLRYGHLFLSATFLVPPVVLVAVRLYQGRLPFLNDGEGRGGLPRRSLFASAIAVLLGPGGVYYALFGAFFVMLAGAGRAAMARRPAPLVAAGLFTILTGSSLGLTLAPSICYRTTQSANADRVSRLASSSEVYALKPTQLLFPVPEHRLRLARRFREEYDQSGAPLLNENGTASLGVVGSLGFLALLGWRFFRRSEEGGPMDALARLNVAGVLLGVCGGLGAVVAFLGFPWIRAYNRISVYLAAFALAAAALMLQRLADRVATTPRRRAGFLCLLTLVALLGALDQVPRNLASRSRLAAEAYAADRDFARRIEQRAGARANLFQLPYVPFPEAPPVGAIPPYAMLTPYVHAPGLSLVSGGVLGTVPDLWYRRAARLPTDAMLDTIVRAGFTALYVDRRGYADKGKQLEQRLRESLGHPLEHQHKHAALYDLREYAVALRGRSAPDEWERSSLAARHPVLVEAAEPFRLRFTEKAGIHYECLKKGELRLFNPRSDARKVMLRLEFQTLDSSPRHVRVEGPGLSFATALAGESVAEIEVTAAPGVTRLRFECNGPLYVLHASCVEHAPAPAARPGRR